VETTQEDPRTLVNRLENEGFSEVAIGGGSTIYSMFLNAGVVTDVYLSIEPIMFGQGVTLSNDKVDIKLKLEEVKKLNDNTILNHYKVIR
jgi:dihydrofolate reductase